MRARDIFSSWPVTSLILIILFFIVALPEILTQLIGRKVLIPILSVISLESRFEILFGLSVAVFSSLQYLVNKSLLRIEEQRSQPFLYAYLPSPGTIIVENAGFGTAWGCKIHIRRLDEDEYYIIRDEAIYPRANKEIKLVELIKSWDGTKQISINIEISYYPEKGAQKKWEDIFEIKPPYQF